MLLQRSVVRKWMRKAAIWRTNFRCFQEPNCKLLWFDRPANFCCCRWKEPCDLGEEAISTSDLNRSFPRSILWFRRRGCWCIRSQPILAKIAAAFNRRVGRVHCFLLVLSLACNRSQRAIVWKEMEPYLNACYHCMGDLWCTKIPCELACSGKTESICETLEKFENHMDTRYII